MKLNEEEELINKLAKQREILYACNDTFEDIKYLQGQGEINEVERDLLNFPQWHYINGLMWNYLILELNKLYSTSSNDKYRIEAVLNSIHSNHKNLSFKKRLVKETLLHF